MKLDPKEQTAETAEETVAEATEETASGTADVTNPEGEGENEE